MEPISFVCVIQSHSLGLIWLAKDQKCSTAAAALKTVSQQLLESGTEERKHLHGQSIWG